jgi:hypothetical protein
LMAAAGQLPPCRARTLRHSSASRRGKTDMPVKTRLVVVREAGEVVLRHLECLPTSERTEELRTGVLDCLRTTEQWIASPPTDLYEDALMKRVLELHVEVTKLERRALLAVVKGSTANPRELLNGRPMLAQRVEGEWLK